MQMLTGEPPGGLVVVPDTFNIVHRELTIELAARHKLPAIYAWAFGVKEGGLIFDRIFKGAKPSDLPVQAPVMFELAINAKVAKVLGLEVPLTLLVRADEVIE
jgi:putative ABC transport system substrate-binding protein